jgi:hypothetical protein
MKYYSLSASDNLDIIGCYPQVTNTEANLFGSPFSSTKINYGEIPDKIPLLELKFDEDSIKTDLLNTFNPSFGLVVSEKFKKNLSNLNLPNHKFYPINIIENDSYLNGYYWFNFYVNIFPYINMEKSKFSIEENRQKIEYEFKSENFFKEKNTECLMHFNKTLRIERIYLLDSFPKYDLFEFENYILISEKLLNILQKTNIIGYEANPYEILQFDNV